MAETPSGGGSLNDRMAALRQQQSQGPQPQDIRTNQFAFDDEDLTPMQAMRNWIARADIKGFAVINVLLVLALFGTLSMLSFISDLFSGDESESPQEIMMNDDMVPTVMPQNSEVRVEMPRDDASDVMVNKEQRDAAFDEAAALADKANGQTMPTPSGSLSPPSASSQGVAVPSATVAPQPRGSVTPAKVATVTPPHLSPLQKPTIVAQAETAAASEEKQPTTPHHDELPRDFKRTAFANNVYQVQLGAFSHQFQLENEWLRLKTHYPSLLQNLSPAVNIVNYGSSGILYRLRLGPFDDEEKARILCVNLQAAGFGCVPIKPSAL